MSLVRLDLSQALMFSLRKNRLLSIPTIAIFLSTASFKITPNSQKEARHSGRRKPLILAYSEELEELQNQ